MNKRLVLKNRRRFMGFITSILLVIFSFVGSVSVHGCKEPSYRTITVQKGDTLWGVAEKFNKKGDIRKYIYELKKLNNLSNSDIFAGDQLLIAE